jgi:hypothetical protein
MPASRFIAIGRDAPRYAMEGATPRPADWRDRQHLRDTYVTMAPSVTIPAQHVRKVRLFL